MSEAQPDLVPNFTPLSLTNYMALGMCICFLWLLWQITTNLVVEHKRNVFSHSSGSKKSKISFTALAKFKMLAGLVLPEGSRGDPLPSLLQLLLATCIPWLLAPLSSKDIIPTSAFVITSLSALTRPSCLPLERTRWIHWALLGNPGWLLHVNNLTLFTATKSLVPHKVTLIGSRD